MTKNDELLLRMIQEYIRSGQYKFTSHALTKHPTAEGFRARHAIHAILNGSIIEHYAGRNRCLICGECSDIQPLPDYISTYIHCVCAYDEASQVVIITMYRPRSDEWVNQFTRRKIQEGGSE